MSFSVTNSVVDAHSRRIQSPSAATVPIFLRRSQYCCYTLGCLIMMLSPSLLNAYTQPPLVLSWGSQGTGPGQFTSATAIAVGPDGSVYVSDSHLNRIQTFSSHGDYILQWGILGSAPGQFGDDGPYGIAFDAAGNVLVADAGNDRIQKFTSTGTYICSIGSAGSSAGKLYNPMDVAVGPSGAVYAADYSNHRVEKFDATGAYVTQWYVDDFTLGITVDPSENVYVSLWFLDAIVKTTSNGTLLGTFGGPGAGDGQFDEPFGLQFDNANQLLEHLSE